MHKTTITLTKEIYEWLRKHSYEEKVSMSKAIRTILIKEMEKKEIEGLMKKYK